MSKFISFLTGILSGALVGAVAAILMTPASGDELRNNLRGRADDLMADLKAAVASERRRLEAELESLKRGDLQLS